MPLGGALSIGAIGALGSGALGIMGNRSAANQSSKDTKRMINFLTQQRQQNEAMYNKAYQPYEQTGTDALPYWQYLMSGGKMGQEFDFTASPAYNWRLGEEQKAINNRMAAMGMSNSRAGVNALTDSTNRLTAQEYDNSANRLGQLVGFGYGATGARTSGIANAGQTYNPMIANAMGQGSQAQQGYTQNAYGMGSNLLSGLTSLPMQMQNYGMLQNALAPQSGYASSQNNPGLRF